MSDLPLNSKLAPSAIYPGEHISLDMDIPNDEMKWVHNPKTSHTDAIGFKEALAKSQPNMVGSGKVSMDGMNKNVSTPSPYLFTESKAHTQMADIAPGESTISISNEEVKRPAANPESKKSRSLEPKAVRSFPSHILREHTLRLIGTEISSDTNIYRYIGDRALDSEAFDQSMHKRPDLSDLSESPQSIDTEGMYPQSHHLTRDKWDSSKILALSDGYEFSMNSKPGIPHSRTHAGNQDVTFVQQEGLSQNPAHINYRIERLISGNEQLTEAFNGLTHPYQKNIDNLETPGVRNLRIGLDNRIPISPQVDGMTLNTGQSGGEKSKESPNSISQINRVNNSDNRQSGIESNQVGISAESELGHTAPGPVSTEQQLRNFQSRAINSVPSQWAMDRVKESARQAEMPDKEIKGQSDTLISGRIENERGIVRGGDVPWNDSGANVSHISVPKDRFIPGNDDTVHEGMSHNDTFLLNSRTEANSGLNPKAAAQSILSDSSVQPEGLSQHSVNINFRIENLISGNEQLTEGFNGLTHQYQKNIDNLEAPDVRNLRNGLENRIPSSTQVDRITSNTEQSGGDVPRSDSGDNERAETIEISTSRSNRLPVIQGQGDNASHISDPKDGFMSGNDDTAHEGLSHKDTSFLNLRTEADPGIHPNAAAQFAHSTHVSDRISDNGLARENSGENEFSYLNHPESHTQETYAGINQNLVSISLGARGEDAALHQQNLPERNNFADSHDAQVKDSRKQVSSQAPIDLEPLMKGSSKEDPSKMLDNVSEKDLGMEDALSMDEPDRTANITMDMPAIEPADRSFIEQKTGWETPEIEPLHFQVQVEPSAERVDLSGAEFVQFSRDSMDDSGLEALSASGDTSSAMDTLTKAEKLGESLMREIVRLRPLVDGQVQLSFDVGGESIEMHLKQEGEWIEATLQVNSDESHSLLQHINGLNDSLQKHHVRVIPDIDSPDENAPNLSWRESSSQRDSQASSSGHQGSDTNQQKLSNRQQGNFEFIETNGQSGNEVVDMSLMDQLA